MHAITLTEFGGPEVMTWAHVDTPTPTAGQVRIKTTAAGVNRADVLQRQGHYLPPPGESDILGLEVSGHIDAIGDDVAGWAVGDPCVALLAGGGYAEYVVVPAGQVTAAPPQLDLTTAGGVMEVAATVVSNMDAARLAAGETLLIHGGTGGIGSFAIQYAKALKVRVLTTAGAPDRLEYCKLLGADVAIDYHDDWLSAVKEATDGRGANVILDVMGAKYLDANVKALAADGRLMVIGLQGGVKGELNLNRLLMKRASITALGLRGRPVEQKSAIVQRVTHSVWPMIADGSIRLSSSSRFDLREAGLAHEQLTSGTNTGKIVLVA